MQRFKTDGEIRIRKTMHGARWTGETIADGDTLRAIIGSAYFRESEFDSVLMKVSEFGYHISTPLDEV